MLDVQLLRYRFVGAEVCVEPVKRFVAGVPAPLQPELTGYFIPKDPEDACNEALGYAHEMLRRIEPKRRQAYALVLDEEGIAAVSHWPCLALAKLSGFTMLDAPAKFYRAADLEGGRPLMLERRNELMGYLWKNGDLEIVSCNDDVGAIGSAWGWGVSAPEIRFIHHGRATRSMLDLVATCRRNFIEKMFTVFWRDFVPTMSDPLISQEEIWLGGSKPNYLWEKPAVQPRAALTFERGSEDELVRLLTHCLSLIDVEDQDFEWQQYLQVGCLDVTMDAARGDEPAQFRHVDVKVSDGLIAVIDAILGLMRPSGVELAGGPLLSKASLKPATINCRLFKGGFPGAASAHKRILHVGEILDFLTANGMSEAEAGALLEKI